MTRWHQFKRLKVDIKRGCKRQHDCLDGFSDMMHLWSPLQRVMSVKCFISSFHYKWNRWKIFNFQKCFCVMETKTVSRAVKNVTWIKGWLVGDRVFVHHSQSKSFAGKPNRKCSYHSNALICGSWIWALILQRKYLRYVAIIWQCSNHFT